MYYTKCIFVIYCTLIFLRGSRSTAVGEAKVAMACPPWIAGTEGARLLESVQLVNLVLGKIDELEILNDTLGRNGLRKHCINDSQHSTLTSQQLHDACAHPQRLAYWPGAKQVH